MDVASMLGVGKEGRALRCGIVTLHGLRKVFMPPRPYGQDGGGVQGTTLGSRPSPPDSGVKVIRTLGSKTTNGGERAAL